MRNLHSKTTQNTFKNKTFSLNKSLILSLFSIVFRGIFVTYSSMKTQITFIMNKFNSILSFRRLALLGAVLLCLSMGTQLAAQGWEKFIGGSDFDELFDVVQTRDFGYIATGYIDDTDLVVYRFDPEGNIVWSRTDLNTNTSFHQGHAIIETDDGSIVIAGSCNACAGGGSDIYVLKLDPHGELLWSEGFGSAVNDEAWDVIEDSSGRIVVTGAYRDASTDDVFMLQLNSSDGSVIRDRKYKGTNDRDDRGFAIIESSTDNNYLIAGSTSFAPDVTFVYLLKISSTTGDTLWTRELGSGLESVGLDLIESINPNTGAPEGYAITGYTITSTSDILLIKTDLDGNQNASVSYGGAEVDRGRAILQTEDGGYLIAGSDGLSALVELPTLIKTDNSGTEEWSQTYGNETSSTLITARFEALAPSREGGYVMVGSRSEGDLIPDPANGFTIKVDTDFDYYTNHVQGRVFFDFNGNCQMDPSEGGLSEWIIATEGDLALYHTSSDDGSFSFPVDSGEYLVRLVPPSDYWSVCTPFFSINLNDYDSTTLNFPVQIETQCAYLEVDAAAPYLSPCTNSDYYVSYCNYGTVAAPDAYIEVDLDPSLILLEATESFTFLGDNTYRFDIGTVGITECDSFRVRVRVDCNAVEEQTHCFEAHIFPDTLCIPTGAWDGSSVAVEANCEGDEVSFTISNEGDEDMTGSVNYVIVEDHLMLRPTGNDGGPFQLETGKDTILRRPANGVTYRIVVGQSEDHPGRSMPSAAIEGCVSGGNNFSTGFYTRLPEDDADNFIVRDCQENIPSNSVPINAKRGYPKGFGDDRLITPETELKYVLNFENNGPDTAIRMVIRDTLSPFLDPTTVRPGASSHDYQLEIIGQGILKFTFEDISLLPNGSAGSRGFVKYSVSQKPDNPPGALIKNGAAIFFNFGHPALTENTCHMIEDFVRVSTQEIFHPSVERVKIYPNPFYQVAVVELIGEERFQEVQFNLYDTMGKLVHGQTEYGNSFTIRREDLPSGFYFYQLESDGQLISTGKVMVH